MNGGLGVKLADLGLATDKTIDSVEAATATHDTEVGQVAGTLAFMAPEQARSLPAADQQSDLYSLGATWFYLLTGQSRLSGGTFSQQLENLLISRRFNALPQDRLPKRLCQIYDRLVAYEPRDRYRDCGEFVSALESELRTGGEPISSDRIRILVVEDSTTDMLRTIHTLGKTNHSLSIYEAGSLAEGKILCRATPIDLILLDLSLPDSDNVSTVMELRRETAEVPIIVLSGTTERTTVQSCMQAGANGFISKLGLDIHGLERCIFVTLSRSSSSPRGH